jgi:hypothetical protein
MLPLCLLLLARIVGAAEIAGTDPNGRYTCEIRKFAGSGISVHRELWNKSSASATFAIPSPGLYEIVVSDDREIPRVDLLLAALAPDQHDVADNFQLAKKTLNAWDNQDYGWPVHDFLRAYLQSLYAS